MKTEFDEYVSKYMDSSLSETEDREFSSLLRRSPELKSEFRSLLAFDDLLSQKFNPQRSERMFIDSLEERVRADSEEGQFVKALNHRIHAGSGRRVSAGMKKSRSSLAAVLLAAAACVVIAAGAYFFNQAQEQDALNLLRAQLIHVSGSVNIERDRLRIEAREEAELQPQDILITGQSGLTAVKYNEEESYISLGNNTRLQFRADAGKDILDLEAGTLDCRIEHRSPDNAFEITTPHSVARIVGTEFRLAVDSSETRLRVLKGVVELSAGGETLLVQAGETAAADGDGITGKSPEIAQNTGSADRGISAGVKEKKADIGKLIDLAKEKREQGDFESALRLLSEGEQSAKNDKWVKQIVYLASEMYYYLGNYEASLAALKKQVRLGYYPLYGEIQIHLIEKRQGTYTGRLKRARNTGGKTGWPVPVMDMFLGNITPEQLLSIAQKEKDKGILSSACMYIGEYYLLEKNTDKAIEFYKKASLIKTDWSDPAMARKRLEQLQHTATGN